MSVHIYRGEGRVIVFPILICHEANWFLTHELPINAKEMGDMVCDAEKYIELKNLEDEFFKIPYSRYKSRKSFVKNNNTCTVMDIDNRLEIVSYLKSKEFPGQYGDVCKVVYLPLIASAEEIGGAVLDVLDAADAYYSNNKFNSNINVTEKVETFNGTALVVTKPSDKHFVDGFDHGAAELYTCYDYTTKDDGEVSAVFFLGLGAELDCDLSRENIMAKWQEMFGIADFFEIDEENKGIFSVRVEFRNKETHKISWFLKQSDDLLLECGMEVYKPGRRRKLDEKLSTQFEEFAAECEFV